jgi:malate dehydrogenase
MTGSNLVIVPAGLARKPGMTRLDLLQKNTEIITKISEKIKEYAQKAIVMMITNPLDAMTYVALKTTGFPNNRVFGMGGMLDLARFTSLIAGSLGVSYESVQSMVIGQHGEAMLPLPRFSSVGGIPLLDMIGEGEANELVEKTRKVAAQVIEMKGATFYAPAKSVADMVQSIVRDKKTVIPVSAYLNGEYGVRDLCIGVPVVLGNNGVERVIELKLNEQEQTQFMKGATALKSALGQIGLHK